MYKVGGQWGEKLNELDCMYISLMTRVAGVFLGPPYQCSATGSYRDESAPFYLGTILGIACICTVVGYGVFRYMKVKKFQYGTMQGYQAQ